MGLDQHFSTVNCADKSQKRTRDRKFDPKRRYGQSINLNQVEICDDDYWTFVACDMDEPCQDCGSLSAHADCIIIAVDGACQNNGTASAKAAAGVFIGDKSAFNDGFVIDVATPTNQIAELRAGIRGLEQALTIQKQGIRGDVLHQVVIKADSEYLVKGMTNWVFKWDSNGSRTSRGTLVSNVSLFKKLQELVKELNALNVEVLFGMCPGSATSKQTDGRIWHCATVGLRSRRILFDTTRKMRENEHSAIHI